MVRIGQDLLSFSDDIVNNAYNSCTNVNQVVSCTDQYEVTDTGILPFYKI